MENRESSRKERVLIDESVMDIYRALRTDGNSDPEHTPFNTYKDIFMLATCLGFRSGRSPQILPSNAKHDIRESVFTESDLALLKAVAIAHTGDVDVLSRPGDVLRIAEEYAHAGIYDVKGHLVDTRGQPLWNLVDLLL